VTTEDARIGEVAKRAGVSSRTLRYYEELGLLTPSTRSTAGTRRYSEADVARLTRIRELQELLGFDLGEIASILNAEDRISDLRSEWSSDDVESTERRAAILAEAAELNERMQAQVRSKMSRLEGFLADLRDRSERVDRAEEELRRMTGQSK
jgi:DNA-binding transcriptional MerR regulator